MCFPFFVSRHHCRHRHHYRHHLMAFTPLSWRAGIEAIRTVGVLDRGHADGADVSEESPAGRHDEFGRKVREGKGDHVFVLFSLRCTV